MSTPSSSLPTLATLGHPRAETPTRIALLADPHLSDADHGSPKMFHRSVEWCREAIIDASTRAVDGILVLGDLTKDGQPAEFSVATELFSIVDCPIFAIPGNHDATKPGADHDGQRVEDFAARYAPGEFPFEWSVGGVTVFGLDSALIESDAGMIEESTLDWLSRRLPDADVPIIALHHNTPAVVDRLREHYDRTMAEGVASPDEWAFYLRNAADLEPVLEAHDVPLVLTGHLHIPAVGSWGPITEVTAPATGTFPQAYLLMDVDESGTTIRYVPVAGSAGIQEALAARMNGNAIARWLTRVASIQLASMPLRVRHDG